jgi:hypothetical protein
METKTMGDTKTILQAEFIKLPYSKKVIGAWAVVHRVRDVTTEDGITYVMDYGIEEVLWEVRFQKPTLKHSKLAQNALHIIKGLYPNAIVGS